MKQFGLIEQRLINEFQHHFPCVEHPYQEIAASLGVTEPEVLEKLTHLKTAGVISRIGPVFAPGRVGCSTLAALAVPADEFLKTARWISALPETNHNYEREDTFNLWFVITAPDQKHLTATIERIQNACPFPLLTLPLLEQFHIDLGFDLSGLQARHCQSPNYAGQPGVLPLQMTAEQCELVGKLQAGIPIVPDPYTALWPDDLAKARSALKQIREWKNTGVIKRFGVVVRHHELGYRENAMVVWDVPDEAVRTLGAQAARIPAVTLCYRRPRQMPEWPYNLFCMIHGKDRLVVEQTIADLGRETGLSAYPTKVLFSKQRFKQQGARYVSA